MNTHVGEFWFIIDATWVSSWVHFVMGKSGSPGPISNNNLFLHYSGKRRECECGVGEAHSACDRHDVGRLAHLFTVMTSGWPRRFSLRESSWYWLERTPKSGVVSARLLSECKGPRQQSHLGFAGTICATKASFGPQKVSVPARYSPDVHRLHPPCLRFSFGAIYRRRLSRLGRCRSYARESSG